MSEVWSVNGTALVDLAWKVEQLPDGPVGRRGDDVLVARRDGQVWRPKPYGARRLPIVMSVVDRDSYGRSSQDVYRANVDQLKRLFHSAQLLEVRRQSTLPDGRTLSRTIRGEAVDSFEVDTPSGMSYGRLVVDLNCPDPFWYEPAKVKTGQSSTFVLFNPGTVQHRNAVVRIHGPATDPTVAAEPAGTEVTWTGSIGSGDWVELDSDAFTVVDQDGTSVAGTISRTVPSFVELAPGRNSLTLSSGTCDVSWKPAYL